MRTWCGQIHDDSTRTQQLPSLNATPPLLYVKPYQDSEKLIKSKDAIIQCDCLMSEHILPKLMTCMTHDS